MHSLLRYWEPWWRSGASRSVHSVKSVGAPTQSSHAPKGGLPGFLSAHGLVPNEFVLPPALHRKQKRRRANISDSGLCRSCTKVAWANNHE